MRTPEQLATALECLRLGCDYSAETSAEAVLERAEKYYAFATGEGGMTIYDPRSPFTLAQEARLREIIREEMDADRVWHEGHANPELLTDERLRKGKYREDAIRDGQREGLGHE